MLKKWKWIRLKLSNAASWYFNSGWIESKITLKQLEFQLSTSLVFQLDWEWRCETETLNVKCLHGIRLQSVAETFRNNIVERVPRLDGVTVRSAGLQTWNHWHLGPLAASSLNNSLHSQDWTWCWIVAGPLQPRALMGRAAASELPRNLGLNLKWMPPRQFWHNCQTWNSRQQGPTQWLLQVWVRRHRVLSARPGPGTGSITSQAFLD
jgi:hypothetical protein